MELKEEIPDKCSSCWLVLVKLLVKLFSQLVNNRRERKNK